MKKMVLLLLVLSSVFYAKGYKNSKCVVPQKWVQTESEDCLYFKVLGDNKTNYCIYVEDLYSGSNGNISDAVDEAMKAKKPILISTDGFVKVLSKNCKLK